MVSIEGKIRMPTTPPRHSLAGSGTEMVTPATPRYGPMFDPDHYALLDRRQQKKQQQSDQHAQRSRPQRRGSTEDAAAGPDADAGTRSRTRTRTRTISGAQPGVQMVTPRETPYRRRRQQQCDLDLAMTEEVVEETGQGKAVARVLFPSTPGTTTTTTVVDDGVDEFGSIRTDRKTAFSIYKDPTTDAGVFDEYADDPFVTRPGTAKKRSRQSVASEWPDPSKKGMAFVFRGKKIFRPFPADNQYSDDEFAIAPVKPRILFPQAISDDPDGSLDSSQPTSSSTIFDDSVADSTTTDVSTQDSSTAGHNKRDSGVAMYDLDRTRTRRTSGSSQDGFGGAPPNPEEEETDIENYYSP